MRVVRTMSTRLEVTFAEVLRWLDLPKDAEIDSVAVVEDTLLIRLKDNNVAKAIGKQVEAVDAVEAIKLA